MRPDAHALREARIQLMRRPELARVLFNAHSRAPQARRGREHHQRFFAQDVCPQIPQTRVHDLAARQLRCGTHAPSVVVEHYVHPRRRGTPTSDPIITSVCRARDVVDVAGMVAHKVAGNRPVVAVGVVTLTVAIGAANVPTAYRSGDSGRRESPIEPGHKGKRSLGATMAQLHGTGSGTIASLRIAATGKERRGP